MPINFPSSPTLNQVYTVGTKTWVWNGYAWDIQSIDSTITATDNLARSAYGKANTANVLAQAAFDKANSSILRVATVGAGNVISNVINSVTGINFDSLSGFSVEDLGSGNVKVSLGSTFKTWTTDGQEDLIAVAEDTVRFIAANGITITTSNTVANGKSITFSGYPIYNLANAASSNTIYTQGVDTTQNTNISAANNLAQGAFEQANAANNLAQGAYNLANTNGGLITIIQGVDNTQNTNISAANNYAQGAFDQANAANNLATSGYAQANAATNSASAAYERANSSYTQANVGATFISSGGTITGNVNITNDLSVSGNLYVLGNTVSINTTSFTVQDALITLGLGNYTTDLLDIGFSAHYNAGTNAHTGIIRDHTTKEYYVFQGYTPELDATNNINIADPSFATANINADYFKGNLISSTAVINGYDIFNYSSAAYGQANAATNSATAAYERANAAYNQANTSINSSAAYERANASFIQANNAFNKANGAVQTGFTTVSANSVSITPSSNTDTLTITAGNNISISACTTTKTITFNALGGSSSTYSYTASATPPSTPDAGDHWYNTSSDILYEYINDGTSSYWVDITSAAISTSGTTVTVETVDILNPFLLAGM